MYLLKINSAMFTLNSVIIAFFASGMAGVIMITVYLCNQSKKVNNFMQQNKNVVPLLLQRSTQHKFNTLRSKLPNSPSVRQEKIKFHLEDLTSKYHNQSICVRTYNEGLDWLIYEFERDN
jgi:hypothetical protein